MMDSQVNNFKLIRKLGSGAFGEVFQGVNPKTNQEVAIKMESIKAKHPQLFFEAKIYLYLHKDSTSQERGIPKVHHCATYGDHNMMVMDLLGPSLGNLFDACDKRFELKTVLMLAIQMLERIEFIHSKGILHRDIEPGNFVMGRGSTEHVVYLIDFGLAKKYVDRDGKHIPYGEGKKPTGTGRYGSMNTYLGIEQARRDDLESLGLVLMYFLRGSLPWQNIKAENIQAKYEKMKEIKVGTSIESLCEGFPDEFVTYLAYCRNLKFEEKPDYDYLKGLFKGLFTKSGFDFDYQYDWNSIKKDEKKESDERED